MRFVISKLKRFRFGGFGGQLADMTVIHCGQNSDSPIFVRLANVKANKQL
jgi:hypothetical protein